MLSYFTNTNVDADRETMLHRSTRVFGAWNSNDAWLMSSGALVVDQRYRFNESFNGTINRKIYKDGALSATDTGTVQRPGGTGETTLFIGLDLVNGSQGGSVRLATCIFVREFFQMHGSRLST